MKLSIQNLMSLKGHPLEILTKEKDAFNETMLEDATLCSFQQTLYSPKMTEMFESVLQVCWVVSLLSLSAN